MRWPFRRKKDPIDTYVDSTLDDMGFKRDKDHHIRAHVMKEDIERFLQDRFKGRMPSEREMSNAFMDFRRMATDSADRAQNQKK